MGWWCEELKTLSAEWLYQGVSPCHVTTNRSTVMTLVSTASPALHTILFRCQAFSVTLKVCHSSPPHQLPSTANPPPSITYFITTLCPDLWVPPEVEQRGEEVRFCTCARKYYWCLFRARVHPTVRTHSCCPPTTHTHGRTRWHKSLQYIGSCGCGGQCCLIPSTVYTAQGLKRSALSHLNRKEKKMKQRNCENDRLKKY